VKVLTDVWVLTGRKIKETMRQPVWLIISFFFPLALLAFYAPFLQSLAGGPGFDRGSVLDVFVPGMLVMLAYLNSAVAGSFLLMELQTGIIERLRVTPASRFALLMGATLRDVLAMLLPGVVLVLVAVPFGFHPHPVGIVLLMALLVLLVIATSAGSTALALTARRMETMSAVVNGTLFPMMMLSGMMLPLAMAPAWMRTVAHVDPLYYAVQAARDLAVGTVASQAVALAFLVFAALAVLATWGATGVYRKALA
jgi:ABC-2 type transport system permease protein